MPTLVNALAVMAKAPVAGAVKTRLVPPLSHDQAAALARVLLSDQLVHLTKVMDGARYLAYAPTEGEALMREIAGSGWELFAQVGRDLGERMACVFTEMWARGHHHVALVGGDLPAIPFETLRQAYDNLSAGAARVVLGPSADGGYYLAGMSQATPEIFAGMTWSHGQVLAETLRRLDGERISCRLLPEWFDIDTLDDLRRLRRLLADSALRQTMPQTDDFLTKLAAAGTLEI